MKTFFDGSPLVGDLRLLHNVTRSVRAFLCASGCYGSLISTTQSAEAELGGVPRLLLPPPLIVWVAPSNPPVRGLYQLIWKLPETPLKSREPVEVASGKYTA
jgi:hypothetical protein